MKVKVYMLSNAIYEFSARDINNAREIAKRIIVEGLWTEGKEEQFYPITQIYKVKIVKS
jgi:hypothetical protein